MVQLKKDLNTLVNTCIVVVIAILCVLSFVSGNSKMSVHRNVVLHNASYEKVFDDYYLDGITQNRQRYSGLSVSKQPKISSNGKIKLNLIEYRSPSVLVTAAQTKGYESKSDFNREVKRLNHKDALKKNWRLILSQMLVYFIFIIGLVSVTNYFIRE